MRPIRPEPISEEAFLPFGRVIRHQGTSVIADAGASFEADACARIPVLEWVRPAQCIGLPFRVERLERHPFSAQTFLPDGNTSFMVLVCPSAVDGAPDLMSIRAFMAPPDVGIVFQRGVWHHSLAPLGQPSFFVMGMMRTGADNDTEFFALQEPDIVVVGEP